MDESVASAKLVLCKTHASTMDYHLDNFDTMTNKYRAMLES